jgi:hypothetical protein
MVNKGFSICGNLAPKITCQKSHFENTPLEKSKDLKKSTSNPYVSVLTRSLNFLRDFFKKWYQTYAPGAFQRLKNFFNFFLKWC